MFDSLWSWISNFYLLCVCSPGIQSILCRSSWHQNSKDLITALKEKSWESAFSALNRWQIVSFRPIAVMLCCNIQRVEVSEQHQQYSSISTTISKLSLRCLAYKLHARPFSEYYVLKKPEQGCEKFGCIRMKICCTKINKQFSNVNAFLELLAMCPTNAIPRKLWFFASLDSYAGPNTS